MRGGSGARGRGGRGGQGRGGRGRGRGGKGIRSAKFDNRPKGIPEPDSSENPDSDSEDHPDSASELPSEDDASVSDSSDSEPEEDPSSKPYNILLESLKSNRPGDDTQRKTKRRKLEHPVAEEISPEDLDRVDEAEGAGEEEEDGDADADEEDATDPFETHFANPTEEYLKSIEAASNNKWQNKKLTHPGVGKMLFSAPECSEISPGKKIDSLKDVKLKKRLEAPFEEHNGGFTPVQKALAPFVFAHQDVLFSSRTLDNAEELRKLYCLHALNHVFKTRDRVIKNNARLSRGEDSEDLELRDQGFTRPKVLFILPTRNACVEVVETLISLSDPEQQENKKRFQDSFTLPADEERISENKPADFRALFSGNHDDLFRLGLKFTRKTMKFFSQFYNSDIIFASPLGLRMAIGEEGDKKRDYDFLSSIEMMVVDQADALLMQNWEHMEHVLKHLNLIPKDPHGCDFGRVRNWYLDSNARYLRQTLVLSAFVTPELNALFAGHMRNIGGRVKTQPEFEGAMMDLALPVRQTFTRYDSKALTTDPDTRFKFFTTAILPTVLRNNSPGTLIFTPTYFDFVRLRNHLSAQDASFGAISEETSVPDVARARSHFFTGRHSILLYTGRAHHFRRYEIRGVTNVVMYALPDNPVFYREIVGGFLGRSLGEGKVESGMGRFRVLFSKWDVLKLERVVGSKRVRVMCTDVGDTFEFV
ncbi:rRNA-binding ribosome biosynthesis protein utp25 [Rhizina undulata]